MDASHSKCAAVINTLHSWCKDYTIKGCGTQPLPWDRSPDSTYGKVSMRRRNIERGSCSVTWVSQFHRWVLSILSFCIRWHQQSRGMHLWRQTLLQDSIMTRLMSSHLCTGCQLWTSTICHQCSTILTKSTWKQVRTVGCLWGPAGAMVALVTGTVDVLRPVLLAGRGQNRDNSEIGEILTTAHREFGGCAHHCAGKPKRRAQDWASLRRRGCVWSGIAEG